MAKPVSKRLSRRRLIALATFVLSLGALHLTYPIPYVYRVLVYRDSDYSDIHEFPSRPIRASDSPRELPIALDPRAAKVLEQHPDVENLATLLEETETTAFLVVHGGRLVEERYLQGNDRSSVQNTFSVSKSLTSALVGLAVSDGVVDLEAPITHYLPELGERDERFERITVENLLDMRSGIRYSHDISFPFVNGDDPQIYYHPDLESVLLEKTEIASPPGAFQYNNYNPPLVGLILRRTTGLPVGEYLEAKLWQPLGAEAAAGWTVDDHGFERMESGFYARARDLARFGLLFLNQGFVADRPVLDPIWVRESTQPYESEELEPFDGRSWDYRAGWWIVRRPRGAPDFCAIGRFGQFIYVSPQHDTVFVRNGPGRGSWGDRDWTSLFYFAAERMNQNMDLPPTDPLSGSVKMES